MRHFFGGFGWTWRSYAVAEFAVYLDDHGASFHLQTLGVGGRPGFGSLDLLSGGVWMRAKNNREEIAV